MDHSHEPIAVPALAPAAPGRCPVDHSAFSAQKSSRSNGAQAGKRPTRDARGVWHIHDFKSARAILRSSDTRQAGFMSESMPKSASRIGKEPVLFQEGEAHRVQRKATARYFTPVAVSSNYRQLMEEATERLVRRLEKRGKANLSRMSMTLAVEVAARVVGLTDSRLPGMAGRLERFFAVSEMPASRWSPRFWRTMIYLNSSISSFFLFDVRPAIEARRKAPQEDVISYLLSQGYNEREILIECITFGAAGMATTREFIQVAAWHLLENDALREAYLAGDDATREKILHETLRLEPVVGQLARRTTAPITVEYEGEEITIPEGALVKLDIQHANMDEAVAGPDGELLCPAREIRQPRTGDMVLGFGDGHHRCPGAHIAIQESDIFLRRLLSLPGIRIHTPPTLTWNPLTQGYELRGFRVAAD